MHICFYITGHGFGHSIRSCQIIKHLPKHYRVTIKTSVPKSLFTSEIPHINATVLYDLSDCGCLQSDSVTVLKDETFAKYSEIANLNRSREESECAWLVENNVNCVVSDIPSWPLVAAKRALLPAILVANFTWYNIYNEYAVTKNHKNLLQTMANEYAQADMCLIPGLEVPDLRAMFRSAIDVPIIARQGTSSSQYLKRALDLAPSSKIALLYLGAWGLSIDWFNISRINGWTFILYGDASNLPDNVKSADGLGMNHADVAASVDCVVSKAGYGTVTESMANGVPLIFIPRLDFSEYAALVKGINEWNGGIVINQDDLFGGNLTNALSQVEQAKMDCRTIRSNGAAAASEHIVNCCESFQ